MEKCGRARQATDDSTVHAYCMLRAKATDTHSEYIILAFCCSNGYANPPRYYVYSTWPALLTAV